MLITADVNLHHLAEVEFARLLFPHFLYHVHLTFRNGELCFTSLRMSYLPELFDYLEFFFIGHLSFLPHLFIQSYLYQYGFMNVYFIFWFIILGLPGGASGKESACQCRRLETWVWCLSQVGPLEEDMVTHCNILAWRILWTEKPGGLYSS